MMRLVLLFVIAMLATSGAAFAQFKTGERASRAEISAFLTGHTVVTHTSAQGTQVEYFARGGKSYLLYPGAKTVVPGKWMLTISGNIMPNGLCLDYGGNDHKSALFTMDGYACMDFRRYFAGVTDRARGDVFGLAKSSKAPIALSKKKASIKALMGK